MTKVGFLCFFSMIFFAPSFSLSAENEINDNIQGLYDSAQKLTVGNSVLAMRVNSVNMKLAALQARFKQLTMENDRLSEEALKLQANDGKRSKSIMDLEKNIFSVDAQVDEFKSKIKNDKGLLETAPSLEKRLDDQLIVLGEKNPSDSVRGNTSTEKLRLLKEIAASKQHQEAVLARVSSGEIVIPVVRVEYSKQASNIETEVRQLQQEIDQINRFPKGNGGDTDDAHLHQLQNQVNVLQRNNDELQQLVEQLQQKLQRVQHDIQQRAEYNRLKDSLEVLNSNGKGLKQQLLNLRHQMVELDKRKMYLESMMR